MDLLTRPEGSRPEDFDVSRRALGSMFFAGYAVAATDGWTPALAHFRRNGVA